MSRGLTEIAATWVWEEQTVAQWDTRVTGFTAKKPASDTQEGLMQDKRTTFEASIVQLHDLTVTGLKMARARPS